MRKHMTHKERLWHFLRCWLIVAGVFALFAGMIATGVAIIVGIIWCVDNGYWMQLAGGSFVLITFVVAFFKWLEES